MHDSAKKGFNVFISGSIPSYLRRITSAIFCIFDANRIHVHILFYLAM